MSVFVGPLGGLVETECLSGLSVQREQRLVERRDIQGRRYVRKFGPVVRSWSAEIGHARPEDLALLHELQAGQDEPWWLVACDAQFTNLLPPRVSRMLDWVVTGSNNLYRGGIVPLDGGGVAATSANPDYTGDDYNYRTPLFPVDPSGGPLTASLYVRAGIGLTAGFRVAWFDAAGSPHLTTPASSVVTTTTDSGPLERLSVTATPPAGAHCGALQFRRAAVVARPAVTWGATLHPWVEGRGASSVVLTPLQETVNAAHPSIASTSAAYTILEVAAGVA